MTIYSIKMHIATCVRYKPSRIYDLPPNLVIYEMILGLETEMKVEWTLPMVTLICHSERLKIP